MNKSESIASLSKALCAFQAEVQNVKKDGTNPFFKSKYATLDGIWDEVRPLLAKHKLALSQFPSGDGELTSILVHESGEWVSAAAKMSIKEHTPQGQGSAITYMRRYAMSSILGIVTEEDDDGNEASKPQAPSKAVAPRTDKKDDFAPCDAVSCKNKANLKYGKLCYTCNLFVKGGGQITKFKSEGAVPDEEVPPPGDQDVPF